MEGIYQNNGQSIKLRFDMDVTEQVLQSLEENEQLTVEQKDFVRNLDWREIAKLLEDRLGEYAAEWVDYEIDRQIETRLTTQTG